MGAWGITVRQSDDGLDLLDTIVAEQLRKANFAAFNVSEAVTLLKQNIQEEIEQYKQKPPSKTTDFYISKRSCTTLPMRHFWSQNAFTTTIRPENWWSMIMSVRITIRSSTISKVLLSQKWICRPFWRN